MKTPNQTSKQDCCWATLWLRRLLFFVAIVLLLAVVPIFFPDRLMDWIHQQLGLGELPSRPITSYLTRSTSMLYAVHGAVMLWTARDIHRLAPMIPLLAWLHVIIGVTLLGIDIQAGMPWWWTIGEGPSIAAGGFLMVWLWKQSVWKQSVWKQSVEATVEHTTEETS